LYLTNDYTATHGVRQALRRAGMTATLDAVSSRAEFLSLHRCGVADLILAPAEGLEGLEISEVLDYARGGAQPVPIVLLGGDTDQRQVLQLWRGAAQFVHVSLLDRLPFVLERTLRKQREKRANDRVQSELDRAADILRENQKLITIGRLAASITHEINNPLESITNLLYLMEADRDAPEKRREYLRLAQRELQRVVQISKQTLTFSRETSSPMRVHLPDLIEEVLTLYGRKLAEKNLRVLRQYGSSEPVIVFPGEMRQVLSNLISNAIEASRPHGRLTLRIRSARNWWDEGVQGIRLSVADTGEGMSAEVRNRLGEPFFTTKGQHGTGLGLWVTRSILNRYGGNLQLRSAVGPERHGTVFSLFLPTNMRPQAVSPRSIAASVPAVEARETGGHASFPEFGTRSKQRVSGD
jgi:two-component system, NtrC family, sensor kinase